jgi:hypothetical protein
VPPTLLARADRGRGDRMREVQYETSLAPG